MSSAAAEARDEVREMGGADARDVTDVMGATGVLGVVVGVVSAVDVGDDAMVVRPLRCGSPEPSTLLAPLPIVR